jgi:hypothetical protein
MAKALAGLSSLAQRQTISETELLADLKTLPDDALSPAGWTIKNILLNNRAAVLPQDLNTVYTAPGPLGSPECRSDTCCVWKYIADAMAAAFRGSGGGECNELARQAVRLGFHDAGTWSKTEGGGGADGSIILAAGEMARSDNRGLETIAGQMMAWYVEPALFFSFSFALYGSQWLLMSPERVLLPPSCTRCLDLERNS